MKAVKKERGCIYALLNEGLQMDMVKIGRSGGGPNAVSEAATRIKKLRTAGVPAPFEPLIVLEVENPKAVETYLHKNVFF